jgi:hypothetical protein
MREDFLAYLWQYQYFDRRQLATTDGEPLLVVAPGQPNTHAGPDFAQAQVEIGGVRWAGAVELHGRTSDWLRHAHARDRAYDQVVLHVVWEHDLPSGDARVARADGSHIPVLELRGRTDPLLVEKFHLLQAQDGIACAPQWSAVSPLTVLAMLDKALVQRLERKAGEVLARLAANHGDWEETTYQTLAKNFGFKVNAEPFLRLAQALPFRVLRKHAPDHLATEALLLGQAGWLSGELADPYLQQLQAEYRFLAHKYDLLPHQLAQHEWKLLRLRPANFPPVRLAQLAALIHQRQSLFVNVIASLDFGPLRVWLGVAQSDYWRQHYLPGQPNATAATLTGLGETSIDNIIINSVAPLLAAYALHKGEEAYLERAISFLEQLPAEANHITKRWAALGLALPHASDTQAVIELYNEFCTPRRCLSCAIGASLVRPG